ncbi:hypothetical protein Xbuh_15110 [Xanthomonas axonopodis pv. bauhiniae]|nr:hypothetical protein Xbuh_15110 [Xanthomonas axonopodis pv. bauhiniae]
MAPVSAGAIHRTISAFTGWGHCASRRVAARLVCVLLGLTLAFLGHLTATLFQRLVLRLIAIHEYTPHCWVGHLALYSEEAVATLVRHYMVDALQTAHLGLEHDLACCLLKLLAVGKAAALAQGFQLAYRAEEHAVVGVARIGEQERAGCG